MIAPVPISLSANRIPTIDENISGPEVPKGIKIDAVISDDSDRAISLSIKSIN